MLMFAGEETCPGTNRKDTLTMKKTNLQDLFLTRARKQNVPLTLFLVNGFQMRGVVAGFDSFTLILESDGKQQLIYKHAISTIVPPRAVALPTESGCD